MWTVTSTEKEDSGLQKMRRPWTCHSLKTERRCDFMLDYSSVKQIEISFN